MRYALAGAETGDPLSQIDTVRAGSASGRATFWKCTLIAAFAFLVLYLVTVTGSTADTVVYVGDIFSYVHHIPNPPKNSLWEFGHLIWRPLGHVLWEIFRPVLLPWSKDNSALELTAVLMAVNFLVGLVLAPLFFFSGRRLGLSVFGAAAVASGFMLCNTVLNYVHSGMSYNPGLAAQMAAFLLILKAFDSTTRRGPLVAMLAGAFLALSGLLWFPYVLTMPVVLLAGIMINHAGDAEVRPLSNIFAPNRLRLLAIAAAAAVLVGLAAFSVGAVFEGITSFAALKAWIVNSSHGVMIDRRLSRLPTGITRSFIDMGNDGIIMKRFVMGDPYAHVRAIDLIRASLWKVIVVFSALLILLVTLARDRKTWPAILLFLAGWVPTLAFAVFLFETAEPARYEPAYLSLFIGICALLRLSRNNSRFPRWSLAVFLLVMAFVNLKAFSWDFRSQNSAADERAFLIHEHTEHNGVAFLLNFRDPVSTYNQKHPFSRLNRVGALPLFHVIEPGNINLAVWRQSAACRIQQAWDAGGEVWLTTRLVASRPQPEWNWAEYDDTRVRWVDVSTFFTPFEIDDRIGGSDGFVRVAPSAKNKQRVQEFCTRAATVAPASNPQSIP